MKTQGKKKLWIYIVLFLVAFVAIRGIGKNETEEESKSQKTVMEKESEKEKETKSPAIPIDYEVYEFYYTQLNAAEQQAYRKMQSAAAAFEEEVSFEGEWTAEQILNIHRALRLDHVEMFWLSNQRSYLRGDPFVFYLEYNYTEKESKEIWQSILWYCDLLKETLQNRDDYGKALGVFEFLVECFEYEQPEEHDMVAGILYGRTVCMGYGFSAKLFLDYLNVPCLYISGFVGDDPEGGRHGWNMVQIDEKWYHMDATWGDDKDAEIGMYYFGFSDRIMQLSRTINTNEGKFDLPIADDPEDNLYYAKEGRYFTSYDTDAICEAFRKSFAEGSSCYLYFPGDALFEEAYDALYNRDIFKLLKNVGIVNKRVFFSKWEKYNIIEISLEDKE